MRAGSRQVVVLLGSNIQPESNLVQAINMLGRQFRILRTSQVWETPAVGSDGPNFLNAAVLLESVLSPRILKEAVLRPIEAALGRVRTDDKNAPRSIDLDVIVWGSRTWDVQIWQHAHAAVPAAELVPALRDQVRQKTLEQVARKFLHQAEIRLRTDVNLKAQAALDFNYFELVGKNKNQRYLVG